MYQMVQMIKKPSELPPAIPFLVLLALFSLAGFVHVQSVNGRAEQAAQSASSAEASNRHLYKLLLSVIAKSDTSCAIEVDPTGQIVWLNEMAQSEFPAIRLGDSISSIMPEGKRVHHDRAFAAAVKKHRLGEGGTTLQIECQANGGRGWKTYRVESWTTPTGAMAFMTRVDDVDDAS